MFGIHAHHGCEVSRWGQPVAGLGSAVGDRFADLSGDLLVQQGGVVAAARPTDYLKGTVTGPGTLENTAMKSRSSGVR
jgi:hypothetical protein